MKSVEIYTKNWCGYCRMAKILLNRLHIPYQEIEITHNTEMEKEMVERAGRHTVPQIFIDNRAIGGFNALSRLVLSGEIQSLMNESAEEKNQ